MPSSFKRRSRACDVRSVRNNQARLIRFMQILAGTVANYRTQLEAAGAPGSLLDSVALRHAALED